MRYHHLIDQLQRELARVTAERDHARDIACRLAECSWITKEQRELLFTPSMACCPVCEGITEHVVGCGPCATAEVAAGWRPRVERRVTGLGYASMTLEQIEALPLSDLADSHARLFLWATQRYMAVAFRLLGCWGFEYKQTLVWRKTTSFSPFGGSVAPNNAEFLLVAVRGKPSVVNRFRTRRVNDAASAMLDGARGMGKGANKHSRKPEAFLDLVEQVSPGPYLELFARRQRLGWDTWGNEALEHVALDDYDAFRHGAQFYMGIGYGDSKPCGSERGCMSRDPAPRLILNVQPRDAEGHVLCELKGCGKPADMFEMVELSPGFWFWLCEQHGTDARRGT